MTGDFNFVERQQDTTSPFSHTPRPQWDKFIHKLSLWDVSCDSHSFFHRPSDSSVGWSSRLDRFYISHSEADLTVVKPTAYSDPEPLVDRGKVGFNSHLPTFLSFFPRSREKKGKRRIGDHVIDHPDFIHLTESRYALLLKENPRANPLLRLSLLSNAIHRTAKDIAFKKTDLDNKIIIFQKAVTLCRSPR